jgi:uncharacterized membrane protein YqjE
MASHNNRPTVEVLQDIIGNIHDIIRSEFGLAKVETHEQLSKAAKSSAVLAVGFLLATYALGFFLLTIVYALEMVVAAWLAALIVAGLVTTAAILVIKVGRERIRRVHLPERTIATMKENVQWAKRQIS